MTNKKLTRTYALLMTIFLMIIIFMLSANTAAQSSQLSSSVSDYFIRLFENIVYLVTGDSMTITISQENFTLLEHFFRKLAHMFLYFLLSVHGMIFLFTYPIKTGKQITSVFLFSFFYACSDELHQFFVAGRAAQLQDVGYDCAGAGIGILFAYLLYSIIYTIYHKKR